MAHTLSIMAVMMIWKDSPNVISASSSVKKKKIAIIMVIPEFEINGFESYGKMIQSFLKHEK